MTSLKPVWDAPIPTECESQILSQIQAVLEDRLGLPELTIPEILELDPLVYLPHPSKVAWCSQLRALHSKRSELEVPGVDRKARALEKFREIEVHNSRFNKIWAERTLGATPFPPELNAVFDGAREKIRSILGPVPRMSQLKFRLGPGACTSVKKKDACPSGKLKASLVCSTPTVPFIPDLIGQLPLYFWTHCSASVEGDEDVFRWSVDLEPSRLELVPKTWKEYRSICVEPLLTSMGALAIGDWIADRLSRAGNCTRDQQRNRDYARLGSLTGIVATLDLTSASDTLSYELVRALLPSEWFYLLRAFRSDETLLPDGTLHRFELFSSMGNGFTFPLETLIFYALAYSFYGRANSGWLSAYGDDLVVPSTNADVFALILEQCGFIVNRSKSFISHNGFRESCGADYVLGTDVRPVYVKDRLSVSGLFRLHNAFLSRGDEELCQLLLSWIPGELKLWGPPFGGDGHLHDREFVCKPYKRSLGYGGYVYDTYRSIPRKRIIRDSAGCILGYSYAVYTSALREQPRSHENGLADPLPGVRGYSLSRVYTLSQ